MTTSAPLPTSPLAPSQIVLGRYRVVGELARGGMGVVYLARAEGALGFVKPVVLKVMAAEYARDPGFREMFVREAQILAHLRHPGIVPVLELGVEDDACVMVLEYVRGFHLGQWLKYRRLKSRPVPVELALLITCDVLDALHYAHNATGPDGAPMQLVHRDISPPNVLLDENGHARVLDFGVARMRGEGAEAGGEGRTFVGRLSYSAPELLTGASAASQSTDVYACAVLLHELLLGRSAFRGPTHADTLRLVLRTTPESLRAHRPDVPEELDALLLRALAKTPDERFASARGLGSALRSLISGAESELRAVLEGELRRDYARPMAEMLGVASLADRDTAWRSVSAVDAAGDGDVSGESATTSAPRRTRVDTPPPTEEAPREARFPRLGWAALVVCGVAVAAGASGLGRGTGGVADASGAAHRPHKADEAPAPTQGALAPALRDALLRRRDALALCVAAHAEAGDDEAQASHQLVLSLRVDAAGRVEAADMAPSIVPESALAGCLREVARAAQLPPPGRTVEVAVPLSFRRNRLR